MSQGSIHGKFVWQELTTEDPATAVSFYAKVVGWHAHGNVTHPTYTEFGIGSSHTAGMMALSDDARAAGVRSNWQPYIGVTDVDGTAAAAEKLGAKVVHPATDIAQVGRFATLNDPQGGVFALFKPFGQAGGGPAPTTVPVGAFAWLELATSDHEAAFAFYGKLFGWQALQRMDMGPQGAYLIFGSDGVQRGGMYKMHAERSSRPYWLPYAEVPNADAAAAAAVAAGGRIIVGPMDVPGGGRMAQVLDPSGAMFAVHSAGSVKAAAPSKPAAKPAAPKPAAVKPAAAAPAAAKAPAPAAPKPVAPKPAASKPAASKAAPKKAAVKKTAAKKKPAARKKAAAKKKPAARKKKAAARKSAVRSTRKSAKKPARKSAAGKKKSAKGRRAAGKARRKK